MGLSVPAYFDGSVAAIYPPGPSPLLDLLLDLLRQFLPTLEMFLTSEMLRDVVKSIGETGMAVGAICGIILDNVIPGTPKERGLNS